MLLIEHSFQGCQSTIALTECENVIFEKNQPIELKSYKSFLQFKSGGRISEIPEGTFRFLPDLVTLYLSFNKI